MATFDSNTFSERGAGGVLVPVHGAAGVVSVRPRASSSGNAAIDLGGTTMYQLQMPISCTATTLSSLRSSTGANGSLVFAGGTVTAALVEINDAQKVVDTKDVWFANLNFLIATSDTTISTPSLSISVAGGAVVSTTIAATISHGIEQNSGQAQVVFSTLPSGGTEGGSVSVSMGGGVAFDGTVTGRAYEHFPTGVAIDARDRMEYLTYPYGGTERTYNVTTGGSIQQNISEAMGINSANMSIEDDGATIGVVRTIVFRRGDRFLPWIRENDSIAGYVTFTKGVNSAIFRRPYNYNTTGCGTHTLTEGVNILSARRDISRDGITNAVSIQGFTYEGASVDVYVSASNSDVRDPPGTISGHIQSNLIETPARGSAVGTIFLQHHNFKPEGATFILPGTAIEPMDMLVVTHADVGMSGATVVATRVEYRFGDGGYITTVQAKRPT